MDEKQVSLDNILKSPRLAALGIFVGIFAAVVVLKSAKILVAVFGLTVLFLAGAYIQQIFLNLYEFDGRKLKQRTETNATAGTKIFFIVLILFAVAFFFYLCSILS